MNVDLLTVLAPAGIAVVGLLLSSRTGTSNQWDVLHELARGWKDAGLERERRATLRMWLDHLPKDRTPEVTDRCGSGRPTVIGEETAEDGTSS
jgi:hypothetical protein